jgi:hypothetical protein
MSPQPIQTKHIPETTNILSSQKSLKQIFNQSLAKHNHRISAKTRAYTESPKRKSPSFAINALVRENVARDEDRGPIQVVKIHVKSAAPPPILPRNKTKSMPETNIEFKNVTRTSIKEMRQDSFLSETNSRKSQSKYSQIPENQQFKVKLSQSKVLQKSEREDRNQTPEKQKSTPDLSLTSPLQFSKLLMSNVNRSSTSRAKSKLDFSNFQ